MKKNAPPANTLSAILDRQIAELVASELETASPPAATSADAMSPLEAAVLSMSHDLAETLRFARSLQEQGRMLETVARALAADMAEVKRAIRGTRT
jgi:hypothetical protein